MEVNEEKNAEKTDSKVTKTISKGKKIASADKEDTVADSKFHIVQKGENLSKIAKKYEVSIATLKKINNLKSSYINSKVNIDFLAQSKTKYASDNIRKIKAT